MALFDFWDIFRPIRNTKGKKISSTGRCRRLRKRSKPLEGVFFRHSVTSVVLGEDDATRSFSGSSIAEPSERSVSFRLRNSLPLMPVIWQSTTHQSVCTNQPLVAVIDMDEGSAKDPTNDHDNDKDPLILLQRAMARELPSGPSIYSSNHVMINSERRKNMVAPLYRLSTLDAMAREHAEAMANNDRLYHADPQQYMDAIVSTSSHDLWHSSSSLQSSRSSSSSTSKTRIMGENVAKGDSIRAIHAQMIQNESHRINILHRCYTHFGIGTARGKGGTLYLCQIYRGG